MCITKYRTGIFKLHTLFYNDNSYFLYMCGIYFYITYFILHYYLGHHTYCHSCQPYSGLLWTPIILQPAKATNRTPAYIRVSTVLWPTSATNRTLAYAGSSTGCHGYQGAFGQPRQRVTRQQHLNFQNLCDANQQVFPARVCCLLSLLCN